MSLPGATKTRFGHEDDRGAFHYMREALADRLDDMFELPNSYLLRVLKAVEWAGDMGRAVIAGDAAGVKRAAEQYREGWHDAEPNVELRSLTAERLLNALQVALFPETYLPDAEVESTLRKDIYDAETEAARRKNEIVDENERRHRVNFETQIENLQRSKKGLEPLPMLELLPLELPEDSPPRPSLLKSGLVPLNGPERSGEYRGRAWLKMIGHPIPEPRDEKIRA